MKPPHLRSALPLLSEERVWGEEHQHHAQRSQPGPVGYCDRNGIAEQNGQSVCIFNLDRNNLAA